MKKPLIIIITVGLAALHFSTQAQTLQSSEVDYYNGIIGDNVIIRADLDMDASLIYYTDANNRSYFLYRMSGNPNTTYQYLWPNHTNITNLWYIINDMEINKDACFFCGAKVTRNQNNGFDTIGIVGRIDMPNAINNYTNLGMSICPIPNTTVLTQMDISNNSSAPQICIAGVERLTQTVISCVAFVEWQNLWKYNVFRVFNTDETLTDITFTNDGNKVVAVSRLNNEHFKFVLRCDYASNLFVFSPIPPPSSGPGGFSRRFYFNTSGLTLLSSTSTNPTWHDNDVTIRIVSHIDPNYITVAYECVDNTKVCESQHQVAMFKVDISNVPLGYSMSIDKQQMVHGYFNEDATFVDMQYWSSSEDRFALLHRLDGSPNNLSSLSFPVWDSYGHMPALFSDQEIIQSIDYKYAASGGQLFMGGKLKPGNEILYSNQVIGFLDVSCHMTRPDIFTEKILGTPNFNHYSFPLNISARDTITINPSNLTINSTPIENRTCISFNVQ